jgi:tetratricopeptide (TPR) repeat protein
MVSFGPPPPSPFYKDARILYLMEEGQYSAALSLFGDSFKTLSPRMLLTKSHCYYLLNSIPDALELLSYAEAQGWRILELYELKGRCLYASGEYHTAKIAFEKADHISPTVSTRRWIQRCVAQIAAGAEEISRRVVRMEATIPHVTPKPVVTAKHEWYQTRTHLVLTWFVKAVVPTQLTFQITRNSMRLGVDQSPPQELVVNFAKEIDPDEPSLTLTQMKLELKLSKAPKAYGTWQQCEV